MMLYPDQCKWQRQKQNYSVVWNVLICDLIFLLTGQQTTTGLGQDILITT